MRKRHHLDMVVVLIVVAGLLLRLWGIAFGLPSLYDPDEWRRVSIACRILRDRDPNPHWFGHPNTTTIYMLSAIYSAVFVIGLVAGSYGSTADYEALYFRDPTLFYLSGRLLIVAFGTITILAVYLIARRVGGRDEGLIAATVLALSPTHVLYSKLIRGDVQMGFFLLVSLWFCLNILEGRKRRDYIGAGFVTGLATATKYPAAVFIASVLLAHLESTGWKLRNLGKHPRLLASGGACLVGAFVGSPFLFLDLGTALGDVRYEARPNHVGATGEGLLGNLLWYLREPLPAALSGLGLLLAGIGLLLFLTSRRRDTRAVASFPIFFLIFISALTLRWDRWIVPAIPFLSIPLAHAVTKGTTWVGQRLNARLVPWVTLGVVVLVVAPLLRADVAQGQNLSRPDTRTLAGEWMLAHIPPGSRVLMESNTPQLPKDAFTFFKVRDGILVELDPEKMDHWLFRPNGSIGKLEDEEVIGEERIQYIVMSNVYDRYLSEGEGYVHWVRTYDKITSGATLVYEIRGITDGAAHHRGGPRIRIYKTDSSRGCSSHLANPYP